MITQDNEADTVLLIDDNIGDLTWLVDTIEEAGFKFTCATNEEEARRRLEAAAAGHEKYLLAVIDVMMATHDIQHVQSVDSKFFQSSKESGVRLCRYAREDLEISPALLPIAVFTARSDDKLKAEIRAIPGVELFQRDGREHEGSFVEYIQRKLARRPGR